jgi:hypothetical protein
MTKRFVITEFFRKPHEIIDEGFQIIYVWYNKKGKAIREQYFRRNNDGIICHSEYRDRFYDENGVLHNDTGEPAALDSHTEFKEYYLHGERHRGHFQPAVIKANGEREYWVYGEKRFSTLSLKME